jgi:Ca2+-binding EF-hand superfamily protein
MLRSALPETSKRRLNMKKTIVLATGLTGLLVTAALANEPYFPRSERGLERLDLNKDGKLTPNELAPAVMKRAARMDANNDKVLTAAEIDAALTKRIEQRRGRIMLLLDRDKDGRITEAEFEGVVEDMFDKADTNGDGGVDLAEIRSFKRGPWRKGLIDGKTAN